MTPIQSNPLGGIRGPQPGARPNQPHRSVGQSFQSILRQQSEQTGALRMSRHASERLERRNIRLTNADWNSINQAVNRAGAKGIKNSLVLKGDVALLVNIPNKTVMTAVTKDAGQEQIFTQIDGAVVL